MDLSLPTHMLTEERPYEDTVNRWSGGETTEVPSPLWCIVTQPKLTNIMTFGLSPFGLLDVEPSLEPKSSHTAPWGVQSDHPEGRGCHPPCLDHINKPHRQTHFVASSPTYSQCQSLLIQSRPVAPVGDLAIGTVWVWPVWGHPRLRPTYLLASP